MYVVSGWGQHPAHPPAWQGAFFYEQEPARGQEVRSTALSLLPTPTPAVSRLMGPTCTPTGAPAWRARGGTTCWCRAATAASPRWLPRPSPARDQTSCVQVCEGAVHTRATRPAPRLTYSPPSYHNTGATPTLMDPFENNTVREDMEMLWV